MTEHSKGMGYVPFQPTERPLAKWRKWLVLASLILAIPLFVLFMLPQQIEVTRVVNINRPAHMIYALISGPRAFNRWSPWVSRDPATRYSFSGPPIGVGSRMSWSSKDSKVGTGTQTMVATQQNIEVTNDIVFGGQGSARARMVIEPFVTSCRVTWHFEFDAGYNPLLRLAGVLGMKKKVGADYERGLDQLKKLAEQMPEMDFSQVLIDGVVNTHGPVPGPALRALTGGAANADLEEVSRKLKLFADAAGFKPRGLLWYEPLQEDKKRQVVYLPVDY